MRYLQQLYQRLLPHTGIIVIVFIGLALRLYNGWQIPLTNDELSALHRLQFSSFSDLINLGIKPDGHPALVQTFLYYYVQLFGNGSLILKLPFVLCGIGAVIVAYRLFLVLLNKPTALAVAVVMACSQFFIMHAQTARPYAPALLFTLLFVHSLLQRKGKYFWITASLWFLMAASTHYIAALTVLMILVSAVCCKFTNLRIAFYIALLSGVCYLPQVSVFIAQVRVGGVGTWLGAPERTFLSNFLAYAFQYEGVIYLLALLGTWATIIKLLAKQTDDAKQRALLFCLMVFAFTLGVSWFYSVWRNPVLQFPVLLFSWPFLIAFIWYGFYQIRFLWVLLLPILCYDLVVKRKHYDVFYQQGYKICMETLSHYASKNTPLFLNGNQPTYFAYYQQARQYNIINARVDSLSLADFDSLLQAVASDTIVVAHGFSLRPEYWAVAKWHYPIVLSLTQQAFNETLVLTRNNQPPCKNKQRYSIKADAQYAMGVTLDNILLQKKPIRITTWVNIADTGNIGFAMKVYNQWGQLLYEGNTHERIGNQLLMGTELMPLATPQKIKVLVFLINDGKQHETSFPVIKVTNGNGRLYGTVLPLFE